MDDEKPDHAIGHDCGECSHGLSLFFAGYGGERDAYDGIIGYDYDLQQNFLDKASHELRL